MGTNGQPIGHHLSSSSGIESSQPDSQPVGFDDNPGELDSL
jgi:hypothetical protein